MTNKYAEVTVLCQEGLPDSHYLYEANVDLTCAGCGATIPVNSFFGRKIPDSQKKPLPHCRQCRPIKIYTSPQRTGVAPRDKEYLYVTDRKESEEIQ